jgi:ABC-type glycerol-3-phosphate transport system substrate-binding protein
MRARQGSILLILAMLLPIAGCSGGAGSSAPPATAAGSASASRNSAAKSCSLLTQTETETAFGQAFLAPNGTDGEPGHCEYFNANGFGLQVEIAHGPSIAATLDADKAKAGAGAADVAGVGEKAFEALQGRRLIEFMKNGSLVTLYSASRIDPDTFRGLARLAAGRLQ